jgi:hypothetical protein
MLGLRCGNTAPRSSVFTGMTDAEIRAFALRHELTEEQARRVLDEHGADESAWDEAARSFVHFLKAPS